MGRWAVEHFDVVAASWLIALVLLWSIVLASMSASRPLDWTGPLIGGVDWNATLVSTPADSTPPARPGSHP